MPRRIQSPPYDPLSYTITRFYVRAKDQQGHSTTMRVPDDIGPLLSAIVRDDTNPYETGADFLRDAAVHRLHYLTNSGQADLEEIADAFLAEAETKAFHQAVERQAVFHKQLDDARSYATEGRHDIAQLLLGYAERMINGYPEVLRDDLRLALDTIRYELNY